MNVGGKRRGTVPRRLKLRGRRTEVGLGGGAGREGGGRGVARRCRRARARAPPSSCATCPSCTRACLAAGVVQRRLDAHLDLDARAVRDHINLWRGDGQRVRRRAGNGSRRRRRGRRGARRVERAAHSRRACAQSARRATCAGSRRARPTERPLMEHSVTHPLCLRERVGRSA